MPEEEVRDEAAAPTTFARRKLLGLVAAGGGVALAAKLGLDGIPGSRWRCWRTCSARCWSRCRHRAACWWRAATTGCCSASRSSTWRCARRASASPPAWC
ncbi:hypothetical protein ACFQZ4_26785 [Catellatospora coxensis]